MSFDPQLTTKVLIAVLFAAASAVAEDLPVASITGAPSSSGEDGYFTLRVVPAEAINVVVYQSGTVATWRTGSDGYYRHRVAAGQEDREYFARIEPREHYIVGNPSWATIFLYALCTDGYHRHGDLACHAESTNHDPPPSKNPPGRDNNDGLLYGAITRLTLEDGSQRRGGTIAMDEHQPEDYRHHCRDTSAITAPREMLDLVRDALLHRSIVTLRLTDCAIEEITVHWETWR